MKNLFRALTWFIGALAVVGMFGYMGGKLCFYIFDMNHNHWLLLLLIPACAMSCFGELYCVHRIVDGAR